MGVIETTIRYIEACNEFKKGEKAVRKKRDEKDARRQELLANIGNAENVRQSLGNCTEELRNKVNLQPFDNKVSEYESELKTVEEEWNKANEEMVSKQEQISRRVENALEAAGKKIREADAAWNVVSEQIEVWSEMPADGPTPQEQWSSVVKSRHVLNREYLEQALALTKEVIADGKPDESRAARELPGYVSELQRCTIPTIIDYNEYMTTNWAEKSRRRQHGNTLALLTMEQATHTLRNGPKPFPIPILIPIELNPSESQPFDARRYLNILSTKENINIHTYYDAPPPNEKFVVPKVMSGKQATEALQSREPANILDIRGSRLRLECLDENPEYCILSDLAFEELDSNNTIGKNITEVGEFTRTSFSLLSSPPAWSDWHYDRHGTVTAVMNEYGEKLWPVQASLSMDEEVKYWKRGETLSSTPIPIALREGDCLLMPASTPHGPITLPSGKEPDVCKMSGRMYLPLHGLVNSAQQTLKDEEDPAGTNEPTASNYWKVMKRIYGLWEEHNSAWEWPSDDQLAQFQSILQERELKMQGYACKCKGGCGKACGCVKKDSPCNERCHTDEGKDRCKNNAATRSPESKS